MTFHQFMVFTVDLMAFTGFVLIVGLILYFINRHNKNSRRLIVFTVSFIIFTYAITSLSKFIDIRNVIPFIPTWVTIIALPLSGIALYWARGHFRVYYGIAEFFAGFATALYVFLPTKFDYSQLETVLYLQILGGLYIMVRGLDNVDKGLEGTPMEPKWKSIFEGPPKDSTANTAP